MFAPCKATCHPIYNVHCYSYTVLTVVHTNSSFGALVTHLTDELTECLKCSDANMQRDTLAPSMNLMHAKELHISVSRTVTIRHHWIRPLIDCLQKELQSKSRLVLCGECGGNIGV